MSFDRVARGYRLLERIVFGGALQGARVAQLDKIEPCERVLLLGDGDGRFLEVLLEKMPGAHVDVVEASAKMISIARNRTAGLGDVRFHQMGIEDFVPDGEYDLAVSHFFLDCFDRDGIDSVIRSVLRCLVADGDWLIADFQIPETGGWKRLRARFLLRAMYLFFRIVAGLSAQKLVDPDKLLTERGFKLQARKLLNQDFVRSDRWARG